MKVVPHNRQLLLDAMPGTMLEIRERTGFSHCASWRFLQEFREAQQCHISGWQTLPGRWAAIWSRGAGPDVPRPLSTKRLRRERVELREAKRLADQLQAAELAEQRRAEREQRGVDLPVRQVMRPARPEVVVRRDPLVAAFFGGAP